MLFYLLIFVYLPFLQIFIDDLVFIGQKLIFIENTTVFSLEQNGVVYKTGQGMIDKKSLLHHDVCFFPAF